MTINTKIMIQKNVNLLENITYDEFPNNQLKWKSIQFIGTKHKCKELLMFYSIDNC